MIEIKAILSAARKAGAAKCIEILGTDLISIGIGGKESPMMIYPVEGSIIKDYGVYLDIRSSEWDHVSMALRGQDMEAIGIDVLCDRFLRSGVYYSSRIVGYGGTEPSVTSLMWWWYHYHECAPEMRKMVFAESDDTNGWMLKENPTYNTVTYSPNSLESVPLPDKEPDRVEYGRSCTGMNARDAWQSVDGLVRIWNV